jgi:hypothetical protein
MSKKRIREIIWAVCILLGLFAIMATLSQIG